MSKDPKHVHKFKRHTYKSTGNAVYFCTKPDCNFKIGTEFALGKMCECWRCGQPFQMTSYSIRAAQPHCANCHNKKTKVPNSDRRIIPTRREADPIIEGLAEKSLSQLQTKMSSLTTAEPDVEDEDL